MTLGRLPAPPTRYALWAIVALLVLNAAAIASGDPRLLGLAFRVQLALVIILPFTGVVVVGFLWYVYLTDQSRPRSRTVWLMATGSTLITIASFTALYVGARALGLDDRNPLPPEVAGVLIGTAVTMGLLVVHLFGLHIYRLWTGRHGRRRKDD